MDATQALECTQALPADWDEDDDLNSREKRVVAWLEIEGFRHEIFEGETKIGRDPATCGIVLQNKVLSKEHALFDVEGEAHTLADLSSMNKTRIGRMVLKPQVRYALQGEEQIRFGDIRAKYIINEKSIIDDSGSETGSESMLLIDNTQEAPPSPVLSHHLPGLDTTNNNSSFGTPRASQAVPKGISDFIPETPNVLQIRGSGEPSLNNMKTFIPESPSASQSTPLPHKSKALPVAESPSNISMIQNMSAGIVDDDSFFFDPSQPVKSKPDKDPEKDKIVTSGGVTSRGSDEKAVSDEEDDIPTQVFGSPNDVQEKKNSDKGLDSSYTKNILAESKMHESNTEGDKNVNAKDNSDENTDSEEDIFNQPTQAFSHFNQSPTKKEVYKISSCVDTKDNSDQNIDSEEDIFNQPTQAFPHLNQSPKKLRKELGKISSSVQEDPDNTQDIMEAFELVPVKSDPGNVAEDDDTDDESLIATQPFEARGKPTKAKHQDDDDDDEVPTQLFLDDDDDEIMFKKPFTVAPKFKKNHLNVAVSNSNISDECSIDYNQDALNTPTQAFIADDQLLSEAPTQAFSNDQGPSEAPTQAFVADDQLLSEAPTQAFSNDQGPSEAPTQAFVADDQDLSEAPTQAFSNNQGPSEAPTQAFDDLAPTQKFDPKHEGVGKEKQPEAKLGEADDDSDIDDYFNQPTQPFLGKEKADKSILDVPTQCFLESSPKNVTKDNNDEVDDFFNEPTQAFVETKFNVDSDFAPTQLYDKKSEDVGVISEDDSLPPTQIFSAPSSDVLKPRRDEDDDSLVATQPFRPNESNSIPKSTEYTSAQRFSSKPVDKDGDCIAPTQIFHEPVVEAGESNDPTQVFCDELLDSADSMAPTQISKSDANGEEGECNAPTQLFIAEDKTSPVKEPQRGISEIWDKLDADATQDISLDIDVEIDETRLGNKSNLQVSSERTNLENKGDCKTSDMCFDDDDNSSTVSENLLEQTKEENYYSDESTDIEEQMLPPKDTAKVQGGTNSSCVLQTSDMSRLELSSDSDIISDVKGIVTQSPINEKSHQELEGKKDTCLDGESEQTPGNNESQRSTPQKEGDNGKTGIHFTRVSKVVASSTVFPKSLGKEAIHSQSTQDSTSIEDVKIYSSDSDESDNEDFKTCKSVPEKVKEVANILSDSDTDDDVGNVSQRLFEFSQDDEKDKSIGKQTNDEGKFEEDYQHKTKGIVETEKEDKLTCAEKMTKDIISDPKEDSPRKRKINTRKTLARTSVNQIQSGIESHKANIGNAITKRETGEKTNESKEVDAEETKNHRTARERRQDKRKSLELDSVIEQKTRSGRIKREPRRFSPDKDSGLTDSSSASAKPKEKTINISKTIEEHPDVLPSKRTRRSAPILLKKDNVNNEEEKHTLLARVGNSAKLQDHDSNRVDVQRSGPQEAVLQAKEILGKKGQRSKSSKETEMKELAQESNFEAKNIDTESVVQEKEMEVQKKKNGTNVLARDPDTVSVEENSEPVRRGRRSMVTKPKKSKTEKDSKLDKETNVTIADIVDKEENVHPQGRQCRSAFARPKGNGTESTNQISKHEAKEKKVKKEENVEPPRRGRRSATTKPEVKTENTDQAVKPKSLDTSVGNKLKELTSGTKQEMLQKNVENSVEEPPEEVKIQPSRRGHRSTVPKLKDCNIENNSETKSKNIETEIESSRRGRRSAIQKPVRDESLNQVSETEDKEKTVGRPKRARRWVVSETKETDISTDADKKPGLKLTFKSMQNEFVEESRPQRRGRASIATSHPTIKEVPTSSRQVRLSMIPEKLDDNDGPSKSKRQKKAENKEVGPCSSVDEKLSEVKVKDKRKQKKKTLAEDSSDSESSLKRSSSQDSQSSHGRKRVRRTSNSSEDIHLTPKSARTINMKMNSPHSKDILWSPSQRQQQADLRPKVLFTGYKDQQDEKIVTDLGGMVVDSPNECSVLVTINIRRTCKLLAVIGKGLPIVTPRWLSASKLARNFVDPWKYIVKDTESEKKFAFRLDQSLRSARKSLLFEGLSFHATRSVKPPPDQMKEIIVCSGGVYLDVPPKKFSQEIRIISCPEDKNHWSTFKRLQIPVLGTEFILTGLLRQQLLLDDFVLA
ncbi:uncharacterized protein LOC122257910 [Penaeus japonicus]|uniref:uncharacterized protein LOC122257910 n=1 Tax=Penaeus japonicus TaxID=27405 RepID=UPI001C71016D|nr:uncharacterized protein LOC122257910 [Penaeus japonicus]